MSRVTQRKLPSPVKGKHVLARYLFWSRLYRATDDAVDEWLVRPAPEPQPAPVYPPVTFKPRDHFTARGKPKRAYNLAEAQRTVQMYPQERLRFYVCTVCAHYHVGHSVKRRAA